MRNRNRYFSEHLLCCYSRAVSRYDRDEKQQGEKYEEVRVVRSRAGARRVRGEQWQERNCEGTRSEIGQKSRRGERITGSSTSWRAVQALRAFITCTRVDLSKGLVSFLLSFRLMFLGRTIFFRGERKLFIYHNTSNEIVTLLFFFFAFLPLFFFLYSISTISMIYRKIYIYTHIHT